MKTISISRETKVEIVSSGIDKLDDYLTTQSRSDKRRIIINMDTVSYISKINSALGQSLNGILKVVPNEDAEFGVLTVEDTNMFTGVRVMSDDFTVLQENVYGDLDKLDEYITMEGANYLIMSTSTWAFLNRVAIFNGDDIDDYPVNGVAYYHSYHKVPVAICELLDFGKIDIA